MILYNVTVKIDTKLNEDWLQWMQETHIPDIMKTGFFTEYKLSRILGEDESIGITYAIQYLSPSMEAFQTYQEKHAPALQEAHSKRYLNRYMAFRTLMEVVDQSS